MKWIKCAGLCSRITILLDVVFQAKVEIYNSLSQLGSRKYEPLDDRVNMLWVVNILLLIGMWLALILGCATWDGIS